MSNSLEIPGLYEPIPFNDYGKNSKKLKLFFTHTVMTGDKDIEKGVFGFGGDAWVVYTLEGCPHCENAKALLDEKGLVYTEHTLKRGEKDTVIDKQLEKAMEKVNRTDFKTFPRIFKPDGTFIGGNSDLQAMKDEL